MQTIQDGAKAPIEVPAFVDTYVGSRRHVPKSYRIGPKMEAAQHYVATHPGCTKSEVSRAVGPHGSNAYGYRIVQRALAAGLIEPRPGPDDRRYYLYATNQPTTEEQS